MGDVGMVGAEPIERQAWLALSVVTVVAFLVVIDVSVVNVAFPSISEDLGARGVQRLMVEGGGKVHTQFLTDNLADELQLVVAPFFVGDSRATREPS